MIFMVCILLCVQQRKWGRLHNIDIYSMMTKVDTNVSTFVYYAQALRYMCRPFLGHHQESHNNIKLSS
jgi:hypothetical protein